MLFRMIYNMTILVLVLVFDKEYHRKRIFIHIFFFLHQSTLFNKIHQTSACLVILLISVFYMNIWNCAFCIKSMKRAREMCRSGKKIKKKIFLLWCSLIYAEVLKSNYSWALHSYTISYKISKTVGLDAFSKCTPREIREASYEARKVCGRWGRDREGYKRGGANRCLFTIISYGRYVHWVCIPPILGSSHFFLTHNSVPKGPSER